MSGVPPAAVHLPAIPIFGGHNWTTVSAALLVIPCLLLAWACAVLSGDRGHRRFPVAAAPDSQHRSSTRKDKGWALGMNAAGGNIGVAVAQKIIPPIVVAGSGGGTVARCCSSARGRRRRGGAFLFMNNLTGPRPM